MSSWVMALGVTVRLVARRGWGMQPGVDRRRGQRWCAGEDTGQTLPCEDVLLESGVTDLSVYDCVPGSELEVDLWVESPNPPGYVQR